MTFFPGRQHPRRHEARCPRAAAFASGQGEGVSAFPEGPPGRAGWRPPRRAQRHELLRQFQGDHPRCVAVRGGRHADLPHRPREHVGQHDLLQAPGPCGPARRPDLHAVHRRRVRRDAAQVHDAAHFSRSPATEPEAATISPRTTNGTSLSSGWTASSRRINK